MPLDSSNVAQFRSEGWTAVPDFWSGEQIRAIRAEIERFQRDGLLRNVATEGDGVTPARSKANLQLCPTSPHSALLRALPFVPHVIEAARMLLGDPILLHLDQVFLKPGRHGMGTNWHQDNAYFKVADPLAGAAMWTAIHDASVANGALRVIPGSFRETYDHARDPDSDHHIRCYPDENRAVTVELPAGGVVFFAYGTAHATGANHTDRERAGLAYHFLNAGAVASDYFTPDKSAPMKHPMLSGPDAEDGSAAYGEPMLPVWEAEAARLAPLARDLSRS